MDDFDLSDTKKSSFGFLQENELPDFARETQIFDPYFDPYAAEEREFRGRGSSNRQRDRSPSPKPKRQHLDTASKLLPHDTPDSFTDLAKIRNSEPLRTDISDIEASEHFDQILGAFRRPALPDGFFDQQQNLRFYLLDIDYHTPFWNKDGSPILRLFGLTSEGYSAALYVQDFAPYFLIRVNTLLGDRLKGLDVEKRRSVFEQFVTWLNDCVERRDPKPPKRKGLYVRAVYPVRKRSIFGYERDESDFLRIETVQPRHVPLARDVLLGKPPKVRTAAKARQDATRDDEDVDEEENNTNDATERVAADKEQIERDGRYGKFEVFEADIQYALNFMVDRNLKGCGWLQVSGDKLQRPSQQHLDTRAQIEFRTTSNDVVALPDAIDVPPIRIVSIDIECSGKDGRFPLPAEDPILCISAILYRLQDGARSTVAVGFAVGSIEGDPTGYVKLEFGKNQPVVDPKTGEWNKDAEIDMLLAFHRFVVEIADADFLSGYNDDNFDKPYLIKRADALGIGQVIRQMSRVRKETCTFSKSTFSSKAFGTRTDLKMHCPGRVNWDIMRITRREVKSRSYTLNYQAAETLGKKKHEISHDQIGPLWLGKDSTGKTRRRILEYVYRPSIFSFLG